eukprot:TRINITY_DN24420_c0_g1_i3.p1 TRINITY_DN24420_c0_g1~~TRINITY_DN24420_c0_g1_i3.p1  ORF type:complete len:123 (-),score=26.21 TRINITY_DN24420_c0_g1_i3:17-385(-)
MNYGRKLEQVSMEQFIERFEEEHAPENLKWNDVYVKIREMVKELFVAVAVAAPKMGEAGTYARAVYGLDVMIEAETYQPKLLEVTFSPDCNRACKYHPHFYNDLFSCLFLREDSSANVDRII